MKFVNMNYKYNSQRKIYSDIITLFTFSSTSVPAVKIKALELQRKNLQKSNTPTQPKQTTPTTSPKSIQSNQ